MILRLLQSLGIATPPPGGTLPVVQRSSQWPRVRAEHLKRFPTCAACGTDKHLAVHHRVPVHEDASQELSALNLLTLCESPSLNCHLFFGHAKNWRAWNPLVVVDAARTLRMILQRKESA